MKEQVEPGSNLVICQKWEESEAGWGVRPDGFSLHVSFEGLKTYIEQYWARMPNRVPEEYSRPSGTPYPVGVSNEVLARIKDAGGLRCYGNYQYPGSGGADRWLLAAREEKRSNILIIAEEIAREAHRGQLYDGKDYVEAHIIPVVSLVAQMGYGELFQAAAWVHDAPEDTGFVTKSWMVERGLPVEVAEVAILLDKSNSKDQEEYRQKISTSPLAVVAKIADSTYNLSAIIAGKHSFTPERAQEKITEYLENIAYLTPFLPDLTELVVLQES